MSCIPAIAIGLGLLYSGCATAADGASVPSAAAPRPERTAARRAGDAPVRSDVKPLDGSSPQFLSTSVDALLASLQPAAKLPLGGGQDLLLDFPDVVAAGKVDVRLVSTVPRTDGIWLVTLQPETEKGVLLAAYTMAAAEPFSPDVVASLTLKKTQTLMLIARSLGKYYAVQRQIKVGTLMPQTGAR